MGKRWVEGIHYTKKDGSLECLKCGKTISSLPGLGPHLAKCYGREGETPSTNGVSEGETLPEEHDAMLELLKDHGIKKGKAITDLMSYRSWDDYKALQEYLELSGVRPDRQKLILEGWSQHRGSTIPLGLIESIRTVTPYQQAVVLTEEKLSQILDEREKKRRKEEEVQILKRRLDQLEHGNSNPQSSEVAQLREELRKSRQDQILSRLDAIERNPKTDNATVQGIKSLENTVRDFIGILNPANPLPKKQLEPNSREGIFNKVNEKYVSEE